MTTDSGVSGANDSEIVEAIAAEIDPFYPNGDTLYNGLTEERARRALAVATPMIEARMLGEIWKHSQKYAACSPDWYIEEYARERNLTIPGMED